MDYDTKPTKRMDLRAYAKLFRVICGFNQTERIDPVKLLDKLPDFEGFSDVRYEIVYGNTLEGNTPAQCNITNDGYLLQFKEKVYQGAYEKNTGGHRMHIMHEIMHAYIDKLGFKPILTRKLTKDVPCYRRLEWIVEAIAGEVMMPYEATKNMTVEQIMEEFGVSQSAAKTRLKY